MSSASSSRHHIDEGGYSSKSKGSYAAGPAQKRHDWMVMYNALVQFGNEKGHCNGTLACLLALLSYSFAQITHQLSLPPNTTVPLRHSRIKVNEEDSVHLGAWLATQRREHLNGKMKPDRLMLMQALVDENKLEWAPMNHSKQSEQTWPIMFECLRMYCEERQAEAPGTEVSSIPENRKWTHPDGHEVGLGRWMHTQNKQRRAGKLRPDRCAKMQELVDAGVFRWPTQRQFKGGSGANNGGENSGDEDDDDEDGFGSGVKRAGAGGGDDFRRKRSRTSSQRGAPEFRNCFEPGDVIMQPTGRKSINPDIDLDAALQDARGGGALSMDHLLYAAASEATKPDLLRLARVRTKQLVNEISVEDTIRFRSDMMQQVGDSQEPLLLRNHSLDLEPGSAYDDVGAGEASGRGTGCSSGNIAANSGLGEGSFSLSSPRAWNRFEVPPPPLSFLAQNLSARLAAVAAGRDKVGDSASLSMSTVDMDDPSQYLSCSSADSETTFLSLDSQMHLKAQVLAHTMTMQSMTTERYRSLLALAAGAEVVLSRNNSNDSGDGDPGAVVLQNPSLDSGLDDLLYRQPQQQVRAQVQSFDDFPID